MRTRREAIEALLKLLRAYDQAEVIIIDPASGARSKLHIPAEPPQVEEDSCAADVLKAIRAAGHRLTTQQVLEAMTRAGDTWSDSTVKAALAELVRDGVLTSRGDVRPRGYGLPEWN